MTSFLIDEMFPLACARILRETYGRDAIHVFEVGLGAVADTRIASTARAEGRALVTENVRDFTNERDFVLVFVKKKNLPVGGGLAMALAKSLDAWAHANPDPYLGEHWPPIG